MEKLGWIKIHKKLLDWEWYHNTNVFRVFIHCLLKANYEDKKWQGVKIERGCFISSYGKIAKEVGLTTMQCRVAIKKLIVTNNITIKTTNKYTHIQIVNYKEYQAVTSNVTNKQQSNNNQITTTKEYKEIKEDKKSVLDDWLSFRISIKKPIKNLDTLKRLVTKFNEKDLDEVEWVVNHSIENTYQGLIWDKYKPLKTKVNESTTLKFSRESEHLL